MDLVQEEMDSCKYVIEIIHFLSIIREICSI